MLTSSLSSNRTVKYKDQRTTFGGWLFFSVMWVLVTNSVDGRDNLLNQGGNLANSPTLFSKFSWNEEINVENLGRQQVKVKIF